MKLKAKRTFVSGVYSARAGDVIDVPDKKAAKLIKIDFAKPATREETPQDAQSAPGSPVKVKKGQPPTPSKKTAKTGKSAATTAAKNGADSED